MVAFFFFLQECVRMVLQSLNAFCSHALIEGRQERDGQKCICDSDRRGGERN